MQPFLEFRRLCRIITTALTIGFCLLLLQGCSEVKKKPRFVIALVDETESFALYKGGKLASEYVFSITNLEGSQGGGCSCKALRERRDIDKFINELNEGKISEGLKQAFLEGRYFLSDNAGVNRKSDIEWEVGDYLVKKEDDKLKVYTTVFWPEALRWVAKIVESLQPDEKFCLIGIDERGFETDDTRTPINTIYERQLKAIQQKRKIIKDQVRELTRRKDKHKSTDILGALYHAAHFLNKQDTHEGTIVIFSDMKQEPKPPTLKDASDLSFPKDTRAYCFYVNASGKQNWQKVTDIWLPIFKSAGLEATKDCFYQRNNVESGFNEAFLRD
ncbi:hypothetical protein KJ693_01230 [bacterium]|nr:hypothetical protein [bacterium]MBU1613912.1 hypothetical protein [bacterium]